MQKKKVRGGENAHGPTKNEKCARGGTTTTEREARAEQRTKNAVKHLRKMSYWKRVEAVGWWCGGGMEYFLHGGSKGTTKSQLRRLISNFFFIFIDELITALISKKWFHIMMHVDRLYKNFTQ